VAPRPPEKDFGLLPVGSTDGADPGLLIGDASLSQPKLALPVKLLQAFQSHLADLRGETQALLEVIARADAESPPSCPGPWCGYLVQALVAFDRADRSLQDVVDAGARPAATLYAISRMDG
jgi:hypothetical protein